MNRITHSIAQGGLLAALAGFSPSVVASDPAPFEPGEAGDEAFEADTYTQVGHFPEEITDEDGDGIADIDDNCPGTPIGSAGVEAVDECGCPVAAVDLCAFDDDGDGVNNCLDKCPNTHAGHRVGPNGCPLPLSEPIRTRVDVKFEFDRWRIQRGYQKDLLALRETLLRYPQITLRFEGHTDWTGYRSYNRKLSMKRANAVRDFVLEGGGIDPARVEAVGFGEERPIATNRSKEGRAQNRRTVVEFKFDRTVVPDNEQPPPTGTMAPEIPATTPGQGPRR